MTDIVPVEQRGERTSWARERVAQLRKFVRTESGSARVLVAAIGAALMWANVDPASYESSWRAVFSVRLGGVGVTHDLRTWINSGLMTLFFLVVGLEARREFDLGDLRHRRRLALPLLTGLAGMAVPVLIYLAIVSGGSGSHGWGVAMSTDTALALGLLAVLGREVPDRIRVFVLTVFVVDDLAALGVVAVVYSNRIVAVPLAVALAAFALLVVARLAGVRSTVVYLALGVVTWVAMLASGVDPVVTGLAIGLATPAYTPTRGALEQATGVVRRFREQPTAELARSATAGLVATLSSNERIQGRILPWASFVIVPVFALANAGIPLGGSFLAHAYTAPLTVGIVTGYVLGKPAGVLAASWALSRLTRGRIRPPVGCAAVTASGTIAGVGFTVALLIADRAFHGSELAEAKLGVLSAAVVASLLTAAVFRGTALLPAARRDRLLVGDPKLIQDLMPEIDPERDHIRGPVNASITVIEFGDFECPDCGRAEPAVRDLLGDTGIRYVWRHLPLRDVHPRAQLAAEAAEAAAAQGAFWPMHNLLMTHQHNLSPDKLLDYATQLGLDTTRFRHDLAGHAHATRVAQDVESADLSGVSGTPTFFVNGRRHYGSFDITALTTAVTTARTQSTVR